MTHEFKTHPEPFQAVWDGRKRFEIRRDDREFAVGDFLHLREYEPTMDAYLSRSCYFLVGYIARGPEWGLPDGMVVMSLSNDFRARFAEGMLVEP